LVSLGKLKEEFSFFRGNYLILIISWILMDFAGELPGTYYSDYVIQLGGSATILGTIMLVSLLALASVQFLGGYLADKYGRRWLVSTLTFGVAISFIFYAAAPSWHFILIGAMTQNLCLLYQPALNALMADSLPARNAYAKHHWEVGDYIPGQQGEGFTPAHWFLVRGIMRAY